MFIACRLDTFGIIHRLAKYKSKQAKLALAWLKQIAYNDVLYKVYTQSLQATDVNYVANLRKALLMGYKDQSINTSKAINGVMPTPQNAAQLYKYIMQMRTQNQQQSQQESQQESSE